MPPTTLPVAVRRLRERFPQVQEALGRSATVARLMSLYGERLQ